MIKFFRHIRQNLIMENPPKENSRAGKTGKYLKYAIGEIVLVMIGILLALQINNWNEHRKNKISWRTYNKSLIKDLEQDSITLKMVTDHIENDSIALEKLSNRLSSKYANNDTLINIARYDIKINSKAYRPPNNKTFLAMQANGIVELFDDKTYALLLDLHNIQIIAESVIKTNNDRFYTLISNFVSKYSFTEFTVINGPLAENAWKNVDTNDLYNTVQGVFSTKKMMNRYTHLQYMAVLVATNKALAQLRKIQNNEF